jgi:nicotinamidase-related amidase
VTAMMRVLVLVCLLSVIGGASALADVQTPSCTAALLVIDVQSAWLTSRALTTDRVLVQEKVAGIADAARAAGVPIIFVIDIAYRYRFTDEQLELAEPLEVLTGDHVVEKMHPNAFLETSLADVLHDLGVTTLLITGYASQACVQETVHGGRLQSFEIIIVEDGHSGGQGGTMAAIWNDMWRREGLQVIPSAEIDFATLCVPSDSLPSGEDGS